MKRFFQCATTFWYYSGQNSQFFYGKIYFVKFDTNKRHLNYLNAACFYIKKDFYLSDRLHELLDFSGSVFCEMLDESTAYDGAFGKLCGLLEGFGIVDPETDHLWIV